MASNSILENSASLQKVVSCPQSLARLLLSSITTFLTDQPAPKLTKHKQTFIASHSRKTTDNTKTRQRVSLSLPINSHQQQLLIRRRAAPACVVEQDRDNHSQHHTQLSQGTGTMKPATRSRTPSKRASEAAAAAREKNEPAAKEASLKIPQRAPMKVSKSPRQPKPPKSPKRFMVTLRISRTTSYKHRHLFTEALATEASTASKEDTDSDATEILTEVAKKKPITKITLHGRTTRGVLEIKPAEPSEKVVAPESQASTKPEPKVSTSPKAAIKPDSETAARTEPKTLTNHMTQISTSPNPQTSLNSEPKISTDPEPKTSTSPKAPTKSTSKAPTRPKLQPSTNLRVTRSSTLTATPTPKVVDQTPQFHESQPPVASHAPTCRSAVTASTSSMVVMGLTVPHHVAPTSEPIQDESSETADDDGSRTVRNERSESAEDADDEMDMESTDDYMQRRGYDFLHRRYGIRHPEAPQETPAEEDDYDPGCDPNVSRLIPKVKEGTLEFRRYSREPVVDAAGLGTIFCNENYIRYARRIMPYRLGTESQERLDRCKEAFELAEAYVRLPKKGKDALRTGYFAYQDLLKEKTEAAQTMRGLQYAP